MEKLSLIDVGLLKEYITNYDPKDGSNIVQGHVIGIDNMIL